MTATLGQAFPKQNTKRAVCIMAVTAANVNPPALATDGIPNYPDSSVNSDIGAGYTGRDARESTLLIHSTAGSGTMVGTFTLWGYLEAAADWFQIPVNAGAALAETAADKITYIQRFQNLGHFDRLALSLAAIGGTSTAFEAFIATGLSGCE